MNRFLQIIAFTLLLRGALISTELHAQEQAVLLEGSVAEQFTGDWPEIVQRGLIRILVPRSKTDFGFDGGEARGFQADLIKEFEKIIAEGRQKGEAPVVVTVLPVRFNQLIPKLLEGYGDIAAGLITITPERLEKVDFASGEKLSVDELLVTSTELSGLSSVEELIGQTVYALAGSSYLAHLHQLNDKFKSEGKGEINIIEADGNLATEDILEMVNAGIVDATVADDFEARLWAQVLSDIVVHEEIKINEDGRVGWAIRKNSPGLTAQLGVAVERVKKGTLLGNILLKRHYQNIQWIENPLYESERAKLEQLVHFFELYGTRYDFDYLALAAQAYQESRLDHSAKSSAGAVGIMQLLPSTAADPNVAISDIEVLENNIHAGAKYMAFLRGRYFSDDSMSKEDQFAFTWASYNAGPARVRRMRARAGEMGLDPNKWFQNVEYAALEIVGLETVRYVANIYKYYIAYRLYANLN